MGKLNEEQKLRYDQLRPKFMNADVYTTPPTNEEVKEFEELVKIIRSGGRRPSQKRPTARRLRSSKARKARKARSTRRR